jgi:hypothetical protein
MRLRCLARAWARGERRFARTKEKNRASVRRFARTKEKNRELAYGAWCAPWSADREADRGEFSHAELGL